MTVLQAAIAASVFALSGMVVGAGIAIVTFVVGTVDGREPVLLPASGES